ncbi:hypothetical protein OH76DRAFT_809869 [Lentinus brumalis]|uniref:Uncharacterized protein n=1 Tax=Lentinus brumalis TaxID=2498619 RepID=A0A371D325_9APHY|nr:hypothetical protein OH76DRAFT_809869 [Polyporus brumalis]
MRPKRTCPTCTSLGDQGEAAACFGFRQISTVNSRASLQVCNTTYLGGSCAPRRRSPRISGCVIFKWSHRLASTKRVRRKNANIYVRVVCVHEGSAGDAPAACRLACIRKLVMANLRVSGVVRPSLWFICGSMINLHTRQTGMKRVARGWHGVSCMVGLCRYVHYANNSRVVRTQHPNGCDYCAF